MVAFSIVGLIHDAMKARIRNARNLSI